MTEETDDDSFFQTFKDDAIVQTLEHARKLIGEQREYIAELEAELAVYKRALDIAAGWPASDHPKYGGDYEKAKPLWIEEFVTKAREAAAEGGERDDWAAG